jgi:hypothetical protein
MKKYIYTSLILSGLLYANDNSIIIYNDNLALINSYENLGAIKKGENKLVFENVSPNIIANSVSISFPKEIHLLEQNFKYDLVNHNNILKYYIDKDIIFKQDNIEYNGILLSVEGLYSVIKNNNKILKIESKDIIVDNIPEGMITKPSLVFRINSLIDNNNILSNLKYLSTGFSWNSDYVANIEGDNLNINGWITLKNNSDVSLKNYKLKVLAGDVNNADNHIMQKRMFAYAAENSSVMMDTEIKQEEFSGYQIYDIPFKVDIDKLSSKQINFLNIKPKQWNKYNYLKLDYINEITNLNFEQVISFNNSKENDLGFPLPKGIFRFYETDKNKLPIFVGSDNLKNIPINEEVNLTIGKNFNSLIDIKLIDSNLKYNKNYTGKESLFYKYKYEIRNNGNKEETYILKQINPLFNTLKENSNIKSNKCLNDQKCSWTEISDSYIEFKFKLLPYEKFDFEATYSN